MGFFDNARNVRLQQELATGPIRPSQEWFSQLAGEVPEFGDLTGQIIAVSGRPRELVDHAVLAATIKLEAELWLRRAADAMQGRHPRITWGNIKIVLDRPDYSGRLLSEFLSTGEATGSAINNKLVEYLTGEVVAKLVAQVQAGEMKPSGPTQPPPQQTTSTSTAESFDTPITAAERTPTADTESASQTLDDTPVKAAPSPPTASRSVETPIPVAPQLVPPRANRRWSGLLALLGVVAVAILMAATVRVFSGNDASRSSSNAYVRDKPAATDFTAGDCSSPPSFEAQRFTVEGEQLTATIRVRSLCSDGAILASDSTRVTIQDGSSTVAAGIFDLATSPIAVPPSDTYLDQRFAFPVGTYWRLPDTLSRVSDLAIEVVELGQSSAPKEISASQINSTPRVAIYGAPPIVDAESAAIEGLKAQADADAALVSSAVADRWIPQISSKRVGLVADGLTWTNADILREHMQLRTRFSQAVLTWSGSWSTYSSPDFWVTSVGVAFPDSRSALDWCVANEFDRDHCYAHIISNSRGPQGTSAYLN
ncbi:hypothetical protein [Rhodococcus opacus]|uniref:hypothetical protein n=1 Tax=Rhodococcus opacus TaxID=37919 RepID=UPI00294948C3|nr:hypothetical protein [Rhodococcus opacus]MDV6244774.1 hypothetical protein [Rhodococcus opacus]